MNFWDTSAIVSLCLNEPGTPKVRPVLDKDPSIVVWWATRTEVISALARQMREGLNSRGERQARKIIEMLAGSWIEIQPAEGLRRLAERLLAVHPLRAADAFQLAAALQWCRGQSAGMCILSFADRLREAAYKEGFDLLP